MLYTIEWTIPATKNTACCIQMPPDITAAKAADQLRKIEIPTDSSVLPPDLKRAAAMFSGKTGAAVSLALSTTMGRPIRIVLKARADDTATSTTHDLCSLHTDGLWPRVSERGRIIAYNDLSVAQENPNKAMLRLLGLLLDLANGRRPLPSHAEIKAKAPAQIADVAAASDARMKLLIAQRSQRSPRN